MTTDPKALATNIEVGLQYHMERGTDPCFRHSPAACRTIIAALRAQPDPGSAPVERREPDFEMMLRKIVYRHRKGLDVTLLVESAHGLIVRKGTQSAFRDESPPPPAEPSRDAQEDPAPWPAGCIKPGACGRHEKCTYDAFGEKCRHYGRNLAEDVHAHRKPALAAARQEGERR